MLKDLKNEIKIGCPSNNGEDVLNKLQEAADHVQEVFEPEPEILPKLHKIDPKNKNGINL